MDTSKIKEQFEKHFGEPQLWVRAPGRVNLIGEHTDYNLGFVLPAAVDKEIVIALSPNGTEDQCHLYALDYDQRFDFVLGDEQSSDMGWPNYIMGTVQQLTKSGHAVKGFDLAFGGDIPIGAGLSSSAALECGTCMALSQLFDFDIDSYQMVRMSQKAEHEFVGVKCGIMDQFASMFGKVNHVIKLDCRSVEHEYFPLDIEGHRLMLLNTNVSHSLASSEYNTRREECEKGVSIIKKYVPEVESLRDCTLDMLQTHREEMPGKVFQRCAYVVGENQRVVEACNDLKEGNLEAFGKEMYATHQGLSQSYEVSCPELDFLVQWSEDKEQILGARMMGGGFGGCTINLVKDQDLPALEKEIKEKYKQQFNRDLGVYYAKIADGTGILQQP